MPLSGDKLRLLAVRYTFIAVLIANLILSGSISVWGADKPGEKIEIVATFFPVYLFTKNITAGIENIRVDLLLPSSYGCPHDYALSPDDIKMLHQANIIVMNGLGMEEFLTKALSSDKRDLRTIIAADNLAPIPLRYYHSHDESSLSPHENNPHIFASPKQAAAMVKTIADSLARFLPEFGEKLID